MRLMSIRHIPRLRQGRGLTLIELMLALTMALVVITAVVSVFVQIMGISKKSQRTLEAAANARSAIETLSNEIKTVDRAPGAVSFLGENVALAKGDGIDNDGDGKIDEEQANGVDDDGDWRAATEENVQISMLRERPGGVNKADLGDPGVDEDDLFKMDRITFKITPTSGSGLISETIIYEVTKFENRPNTLVRHDQKMKAVGNMTETIAPLAYNVLSFNLLYWNPNATPANQGWREAWDSKAATSAPGFELPASVFVDIVILDDEVPIENYALGEKVNTFSLKSIINIESVIQDIAFPRNP